MAEQLLTLELLVIALGIGFVAAMIGAAHFYSGRSGPERPPEPPKRARPSDDRGPGTGS